ncbi:hypothetical protein CFIO01_00045 [Colletotrichum fioriniae PJ7]|uniref:Uncharacterized protein n=1 Tax=Colletotrichum fioriniae PJ7 TaxID=1445577 RepID=A0A010SN58_9PEZI|nr:hypothetical protein CFIO01_00045 [Colletotrichum fioriniae PJ7]
MIWSIDFQGSGTSAEPVEQNSPGEVPESLLNKKLPNCKSGEYCDAIKDMGTFWYNPGAEQWADEYINSQTDHSNWAQNLYRELFPKKVHIKYSCQKPGAPCDHDLTCGIRSGAPKAPLDLASILGAAFSIGSALATPAAAVAGSLAGISGVMYLASATGDSGGSDDAVEVTDAIWGLLAIVAKQGLTNIRAIVASTFGKQGHKQKEHVWSSETTNLNTAWEADKNRCLDILAWYPKKVSQTLSGNKDMEALWTDWNMDKLGTLRNAVEYWENNNGHVGKTGIRERSWASETPPPCFFAMPVLKGNYIDVSKGSI